MHQAILTRQPTNYGAPEPLAPAPKPQRRFQFIDNNNVTSMGTNSTQVRRHVMQEYMREKRWEARSKLETDPEAEMQPRKTVQRTRHRKNTSISRRSKTKSIDSTSSNGTIDGFGSIDARLALSGAAHTSILLSPVIRHASIPGKHLVRHKARSFVLRPADFARIADMWPDTSSQTPRPNSYRHDRLSNLTASFVVKIESKLQTDLSAARMDPFDVLPLTLDRGDWELFDLYATSMPKYLYGIQNQRFYHRNWHQSVFVPEAMTSALSFQTMILAPAAQVQARKRGLIATYLTIKHTSRSNQLLVQHYNNYPQDCSDSVISAALSTALLEDLVRNSEKEDKVHLHWQAAVSRICNRGGLPTLARSPRIQKLLLWSDYTLSTSRSYGTLPVPGYNLSQNSLDNSEVGIMTWQELHECYNEFVTFLKCIEHLAIVQANMQHNLVARRQQYWRYSMFQPGRPLHNLLVKQTGTPPTTPHTVQEVLCRIACLLTFNIAIWEYRHTIELSEGYFAELASNIRQSGLERYPSTETLVQILLDGNKHPGLQHSERPWIVGRMLKVVRRLSKQSFEFLNTFLLTCLTLGSNLQPVVRDWENELGAEVLQAPLRMDNVFFL